MFLVLPPPISSRLNGLNRIALKAQSLAALVRELREQHPELYGLLFTPKGTLNGFVNLYINQQRVSHQLSSDAALPDDTVVEAVVSVSGG